MTPTKQSCIGTSFHWHTVSATVNELKKLLGEPVWSPNDGKDKVNFEWELETENGQVFTVYDYKHYEPLELDEKINWHIGAKNSNVSAQGKSEIEAAMKGSEVGV